VVATQRPRRRQPPDRSCAPPGAPPGRVYAVFAVGLSTARRYYL